MCDEREQRKQSEEQLSQQEDSEKEHRGKLVRDILIESHGKALTKLDEDCRQQMALKLAATLEEQRTQSALHLREQMDKSRREVELELTVDREKNQLLLLQYQRDSAQLQQKLEEKEQKLRGLTEELQQERRSREAEKMTHDEQRRREEEIHQELKRTQQQESLQLSQAKAELQELKEEVALLEETVRREFGEREELTAALSKVQEELLGLCSPVSHQGSCRSPPNPMERHTSPGNKHFHLHSQDQVPLTRSSTFPNTLRSSPACTDKDKGRSTDGGGARRSLESWNRGGVSGGEKWREGTLPRLRANSTVSEVTCKVSLVMGRKERL
ncbi:leucine-, glutamate- and lysine-rich protein 1 [Xiphias gladius]|uniref:leucine-, glutamate- and lysine-rich protein 1 n=1 Tax=Xiphias gladius TaxID=8245 RepID=UPI001A98C0DA|nr:leucine-, glutamate- and lysine-rich protein 1 [Xiphias gladius]